MLHYSRDSVMLPAITMEDDLGIVYLVENAQQFWSELEDMLSLPKGIPTLEQLDLTLRRSIALCASYHEQYLQSPFQLEHACSMLLESELFTFHSERMCDIVTNEAKSNTDPHFQLICYHVLLSYGRRRSDFFRSHKRWQPLLPLLMDHILLEIESDVEDTYFGIAGGSSGTNVPVPIEAKLRSFSVKLLYEMCRVQKLSVVDLKVFDDAFLDYLFDLVEQTRHMQDETFNYSVIKLIVALNEQFMVAGLGDEVIPASQTRHHRHPSSSNPESKNRVIRVLMRRLGSSQTFGENMIFMLNRAQRTPEDLCMQLLVLKLLYLLFTNKGTEEYFYTNDLCVLVDVFLRELADLDEESESLRHTYLRVLHPLLTKTQLRTVPYKRPQILYTLESLVRNSRVREVNPTTKRLVERCLSGEWCVQLKQTRKEKEVDDDKGSDSSWTAADVGQSSKAHPYGTRSHLGVHTSSKEKAPRTLKTSKSMEFSKRDGAVDDAGTSFETPLHPPHPHPHPHAQTHPNLPRSPRSPLFETVRRSSNASSTHSYNNVAAAVPPPISITSPPASATSTSATSFSSPSGPGRVPPKRSGTANSAHVEGAFADRDRGDYYHPRMSSEESLGEALDSTLVLGSLTSHSHPHTHHSNPNSSKGHPVSAGTGTGVGVGAGTATSASSASSSSGTQTQTHTQRRSAPPPPTQKRRKPPAIPVSKTTSRGGVTFTAIKSSVSSPLGR